MTEEQKVTLDTMGVELDKTMDRFLNKEDFYLKMLSKFSDDTSFAELQKCLEAQDFAEAFKSAHTLKGLSANLGFGVLDKQIVPFTELLRNPPYDAEAIAQGFIVLQEAYEIVRKGIRVLTTAV